MNVFTSSAVAACATLSAPEGTAASAIIAENVLDVTSHCHVNGDNGLQDSAGMSFEATIVAPQPLSFPSIDQIGSVASVAEISSAAKNAICHPTEALKTPPPTSMELQTFATNQNIAPAPPAPALPLPVVPVTLEPPPSPESLAPSPPQDLSPTERNEIKETNGVLRQLDLKMNEKRNRFIMQMKKQNAINHAIHLDSMGEERESHDISRHPVDSGCLSQSLVQQHQQQPPRLLNIGIEHNAQCEVSTIKIEQEGHMSQEHSRHSMSDSPVDEHGRHLLLPPVQQEPMLVKIESNGCLRAPSDDVQQLNNSACPQKDYHRSNLEASYHAVRGPVPPHATAALNGHIKQNAPAAFEYAPPMWTHHRQNPMSLPESPESNGLSALNLSANGALNHQQASHGPGPPVHYLRAQHVPLNHADLRPQDSSHLNSGQPSLQAMAALHQAPPPPQQQQPAPHNLVHHQQQQLAIHHQQQAARPHAVPTSIPVSVVTRVSNGNTSQRYAHPGTNGGQPISPAEAARQSSNEMDESMVCYRNNSSGRRTSGTATISTGTRPTATSMPSAMPPSGGARPAPLQSGNPAKPFACGLCGKQLASKNVYQLHLRSHSGEKPFACPLCGNCFSQKTSLTRHMRSHTGERPYACPVCDKRFADKERIKIHMRTHTGEKPFTCSECGKNFSQKSTVKRHMSVHTGERPYKCAHCGKGFANRGNLTAHAKTHSQSQAA